MAPVDIDDYRPADLQPLLRMWRESFEHGVGVVDPHPLDEQAAYFEREVLPRHAVRVARADGQILGFVASNDTSVAQLYVRVGHHRRGIGRRLLDEAKARSGGSLWLYAFARNAGACAFYERQGFAVVARGFEPNWQLDDVKYAWTLSTVASPTP